MGSEDTRVDDTSHCERTPHDSTHCGHEVVQWLLLEGVLDSYGCELVLEPDGGKQSHALWTCLILLNN